MARVCANISWGDRDWKGRQLLHAPSPRWKLRERTARAENIRFFSATKLRKRIILDRARVYAPLSVSKWNTYRIIAVHPVSFVWVLLREWLRCLTPCPHANIIRSYAVVWSRSLSFEGDSDFGPYLFHLDLCVILLQSIWLLCNLFYN